MTLEHRHVARLLQPEAWQRVNRRLAAKMLGEYEYEGLLSYELLPGQKDDEGGERQERLLYRLQLAQTTWLFAGVRDALGHLWIEAESVVCRRDGGDDAGIDALQLTLETAPLMGVTAFTLANLIRELQQTMLADMTLEDKSVPCDELLDREAEVLESLLNGHPWVVMSKGRFGFSYQHLQSYTPEAVRPQRLQWLAARKGLSRTAAVLGDSYESVTRAEMGEHTWSDAVAQLRALGLAADDFCFLPVHAWQVDHVIISVFAGALARRDMVLLGEGNHDYLALQSLRTMAPVDQGQKRHVKLALNILNTSVYRGIDARRAALAPQLTDWLQAKLMADAFLCERGRFQLLGEVAAASVANPYFESIAGAPYQYKETLGVVWRDNPRTKLQPGQSLLPLGALTHVDPQGAACVERVIARSGLPATDWLDGLGEALVPLYHVMARYGISFNPHGQNVLLILEGWKPCGVLIRDYIDDVNRVDEPLPELVDFPQDLCAEHGGVIAALPAPVVTHFIFSSLFMCVLRYVGRLLEVSSYQVSEGRFWALIRQAFVRYQQRFPELQERFRMFDLFAPEMDRVCVNRVRLLTYGYQDRAERPVAATHGYVANPFVLFEGERAYGEN